MPSDVATHRNARKAQELCAVGWSHTAVAVIWALCHGSGRLFLRDESECLNLPPTLMLVSNHQQRRQDEVRLVHGSQHQGKRQARASGSTHTTSPISAPTTAPRVTGSRGIHTWRKSKEAGARLNARQRAHLGFGRHSVAHTEHDVCCLQVCRGQCEQPCPTSDSATRRAQARMHWSGAGLEDNPCESRMGEVAHGAPNPRVEAPSAAPNCFSLAPNTWMSHGCGP